MEKSVSFMLVRGAGANQISQVWNGCDFLQPVAEVVPKRNTQFSARFL